jgi:type IV fimbrial biogenesis protein FimT
MRRTAHGFTLIELLTTLAVLAILAGLGTPAFRAIIARSKASAATADLTASLAAARISAITRGGTTVCPSVDGSRCSDGSDWSQGWIAFRGQSRNMGPETEVDRIEVHGPLPQGVRVVASAGRTRIRYLPTGWASGTNVTLSICVGAERLGKVVMNNAGRVRTERDAAPCPST